MAGHQSLISALVSKEQYPLASLAFSSLLRAGMLPSSSLLSSLSSAVDAVNKNRAAPSPRALEFLLLVADGMAGRRVPIGGDFYSFVLHRCADQAERKYREVGARMAEARRRFNTEEGGGGGRGRERSVRGEGRATWTSTVEGRGAAGSVPEEKASNKGPSTLQVRIGPQGSDFAKVENAERRVAEVARKVGGAQLSRSGRDWAE